VGSSWFIAQIAKTNVLTDILAFGIILQLAQVVRWFIEGERCQLCCSTSNKEEIALNCEHCPACSHLLQLPVLRVKNRFALPREQVFLSIVLRHCRLHLLALA
jgi:hypothetical protein